MVGLDEPDATMASAAWPNDPKVRERRGRAATRENLGNKQTLDPISINHFRPHVPFSRLSHSRASSDLARKPFDLCLSC